MYRPALPSAFLGRSQWLFVRAAAVIERAQHDECLSHVHLGVDHALGAVATKVGHLIVPQVTTGDHSRGTVCFGSVACGNKQAKEHVTPLVVRLCFAVTCVVVLVITMESLRRRTRWDVKGDGDGKQRVTGGRQRFFTVPMCRFQCQKMLAQVLVYGVGEELLTYGRASANEPSHCPSLAL